MSKMLRNLLRRLDRPVEAAWDDGSLFDLDVLQRSFKESLLVARMLRRPVRYLRGRSGARTGRA